MYKLESFKPKNSKRELKKYLLDHRVVLNCFFHEHQEFYKYHNSGNTCFDQVYFLRGKQDVKKYINSFYFIVDERFCTNHCYLTAKILANQLFSAYLESSLSELKTSPFISQFPKSQDVKLTWSKSKVALIELAYALHEDCAVNDGKIELKEMIELLESVFNTSLGQYSATFLELRLRKNGKTKYLDNLKEKLLQRMDKTIV